MSKVLSTDGHARPHGGVPPHAAALLAVRALGRGTGAVLEVGRSINIKISCVCVKLFEDQKGERGKMA